MSVYIGLLLRRRDPLVDVGVERAFWLDGSEVDFGDPVTGRGKGPWAGARQNGQVPDEPNNFGQQRESCVAMDGSNGQLWMDLVCYTQMSGFLCKKAIIFGHKCWLIPRI